MRGYVYRVVLCFCGLVLRGVVLGCVALRLVFFNEKKRKNVIRRQHFHDLLDVQKKLV